MTPWTVAHQLLCAWDSPDKNTGVGCQGLPFPSPGDLPDSGIEPTSPALAGRFFTTKPPGKPIKGNLGKLKIKIEETGIYGRYIGFLALTY